MNKKFGSLAFKELLRDFNDAKRNLTHYYKKSGGLSLTENEKDSLLWFLENFDYVEEAIQTLKNSLNIKTGSQLPLVDEATGELRIMDVLSDFLASRRKITSSNLTAYLADYQTKKNLTLAELWFVPNALQFLILTELDESLRPIFSEVTTGGTGSEKKIKYLITSLIHCSKTNWKIFVEKNSFVEKILSRDPANIYRQMDFTTRDTYRHTIENIGKQSGRDEFAVATAALDLAKKANKESNHIGFYLAGREKHVLEEMLGYRPSWRELFQNSIKRTEGRYLEYGVLVASFMLALFIALLPFGHLPLMIVMLLWLLLAVALESIVSRVLIRLIPPQPLYKLNYEDEVLEKSRTLVVVPTILTEDPFEPQKLLDNLELNYISNQDANIFFGLALSFQETKEKADEPTKAQLENLDRIKEGIYELNKRYPGNADPFLVIFRRRQWSDCQELCLEWERKRGKILEVAKLLRGEGEAEMRYVSASPEILQTIRYVITLDRDEQLTKAAAKKLIATITHPLNKAVVNKELGVVRDGYGIIQPRMGIAQGIKNNLFGKMLGDRGWDTYSGISSSFHQDIFSEGIFFGKGILDVDVFLNVLEDRLPDNTVLSHDIIEGFYLRTGYASDIQVFEEVPGGYSSYSQRKERWTRGDWQNIFWIFRKIKSQSGEKKENNPLLFFQKWAILCNLLRSLVFPVATILLVYIWTAVPAGYSQLLALIVILALNSDSLVSLFDLLPKSHSIPAWRFYLKSIGANLLTIGSNVVFKIVFSLHLATLSIAAITRALVRILVTHKRTLEWQSFHLTNHSEKQSLLSLIRLTYPSQILGLLILWIYLAGEVRMFPLLLLICWIASPFIAYIYSIDWSIEQKNLSEKDLNRLRTIALKTWRYFDDLVGEDTNYLPPDHLLDEGRGKVSQMTSITNVGVYLLSAESSRNLGYITNFDFLERIERTVETISKLECYRGHFFNWYDVKSTKALMPRYISTVDSGNFAASLMTMAGVMSDLSSQKIINQNAIEAINDCVVMMLRLYDENGFSALEVKSLSHELNRLQTLYRRENIESPRSSLELYLALGSELEKISEKVSHPKQVKQKQGFFYWLERARVIVRENQEMLNLYYPWIENKKITKPAKIFDDLEANHSCLSLELALKKKIQSLKTVDNSNEEKAIILDYLNLALKNIDRMKKRTSLLSQVFKKLIGEMDFDFLYCKDRELFKIGYNVDKNRFDKGYYDLYASEARLASFIALSNNSIGLEHWSHLGRPLAHHRGRLVVLSWAGSIFEYWFPQIFLPTRENSLQSLAEKSAFYIQTEYAAENKIPWGISESSYVQKKRTGDYPYKLHGIASLGIRRVTKKDLVVAPYATFLALGHNPRLAIENIKRLQHLGTENKYGFYESIDFTRSLDGEMARVFMAHHQGAILMSIANYLNDRPLERMFMENIENRAVSYLFNEGVVVRGKLKNVRKVEGATKLKFSFKQKPEPHSESLVIPLMQMITNGRLKSYVSSRGTGFIEYGNLELIPFSRDSINDLSGCHIYLKDNRGDEVWSVGLRPSRVSPQYYNYQFLDNYIKIERLNYGIFSELEVFIHPTLNAEIRAITLTNKSQIKRSISLCSYGEPTLFEHFEYSAQPNFQKIKLSSNYLNKNGIIFKKRVGVSEHSPVFAHLLIAKAREESTIERMFDRRLFIGAGSLSKPEALAGPVLPKDGPGFDKMFALKSTVKLLPLEKRTIFFVNVYAGKENRLENTLASLGDFNQLNSHLEQEKAKAGKEPFSKNTTQQILSQFFYGKRSLVGFESEVRSAQNQIKIDWNLPTVALEVEQSHTNEFLKESLSVLSKLVSRGFKLNVVVISYEKDEYSQNTHNLVQGVIEEIDQGQKETSKPLAERVTYLNEAALDKSVYLGIITAADIHWQASKHSLADTVEQDFRRINV